MCLVVFLDVMWTRLSSMFHQLKAQRVHCFIPKSTVPSETDYFCRFLVWGLFHILDVFTEEFICRGTSTDEHWQLKTEQMYCTRVQNRNLAPT